MPKVEFAKFDCKGTGLPVNVPWMPAPRGRLRILSDKECAKLLAINTAYLEKVAKAQREAQGDWENPANIDEVKSIAPELRRLYHT